MKRLSRNRHNVWPLKLLALVLWVGVSQAYGALPRCPEPLGPQPGHVGLGLAIQSNSPSRLPNFQVPIASYGVVVLVPLNKHRLYIQGTYGQENGLEMMLGEAGFRATIPTPFFSFLLSAGMHYLHYENKSAGQTHGFVGAHGGAGLALDLGSSLEAMLGLKLLFQTKPIFSYGATLSIML